MKSKNNKNSYFKKLKKHHVKKIKLFKKAWKDSKGNISIVAAALILISFLILSIIILNVSLDEIHSNEEAISSNQYEYILKDYRRNLPLLEREALEELSEEVIKKKTPCTDSKDDLKKIIDEKLKAENEEYYKDYGIRIESHVSSIENSSNPFAVKIKTYISSVKGDLSYRNILEDDISVEGLRDPVPILICGRDPSFKYNETWSGNQKVTVDFSIGQVKSFTICVPGQNNLDINAYGNTKNVENLGNGVYKITPKWNVNNFAFTMSGLTAEGQPPMYIVSYEKA